MKKVGLGLGVAGVVGLGVGSVFGLRAMSINDDAKGHCPQSPRCNDPEGPELTRDAQSAATVSTIAFVAGAALLVGGAILWFTAPSRSSTPLGSRASVTSF
jgi:serine/threonine-protein kinase